MKQFLKVVIFFSFMVIKVHVHVNHITPSAVHYEKIRIHLREKATNSAKIHSLARKSEHLRVNQIQ